MPAPKSPEFRRRALDWLGRGRQSRRRHGIWGSGREVGPGRILRPCRRKVGDVVSVCVNQNDDPVALIQQIEPTISAETSPIESLADNGTQPVDSPRAYPSDGQRINLNASPLSFINVPAPVVKWSYDIYGMELVAQPGHFDGGGSSIVFNWYNDANGYLHLSVRAWVIRDNGGPANAGNTGVAGAQWLNYWRNVTNNASGSGGGGV